MPRPKRRDAALRATILTTARALLEAEGVAACTTRRIARLADTSPPALYELFGDKAGVLRAVVFDGFRDLGRALKRMEPADDPRGALVAIVGVFRTFTNAHPTLTGLMFSRPVTALEPDPEERAASDGVRRHILAQVEACIAAGRLVGDPTDIAHALLALAMGLAQQERAGWLGSTEASRARRWTLGVRALLDGLSPAPVASPR